MDLSMTQALQAYEKQHELNEKEFEEQVQRIVGEGMNALSINLLEVLKEEIQNKKINEENTALENKYFNYGIAQAEEIIDDFITAIRQDERREENLCYNESFCETRDCSECSFHDDEMTKETAINLLDNLIGVVEDNHGSDYDEALKMGIKALEDKRERL